MAKRIVIGSVLKPLDDVRHFYKLGKTLASLPDVELFILARNTSYPLAKERNIVFKAINSTSSSLFNRYFAPLRFLVELFKLRPLVVIVSTHELLRFAVLGKFILGYRLVYDVQENYRMNIKTNRTYNGLLQKMLSLDVWLSETIAKPFVVQFWLAEACYLQELSIPSNRSFVFENKALVSQKVNNISLKEKKEIIIVFSGTVAEENGIWESIVLTDKLYALDERFRLQVVGCCHHTLLLQKLISATEGRSYIQLEISSLPLSYPVILKAMQQADIGLIAYQDQVNFKSKMPTKLYEYVALGKPILLPHNPLWKGYLASFECSVSLDFNRIDAKEVYEQLMETTFYPKGNESLYALWASTKYEFSGLSKQLLN